MDTDTFMTTLYVMVDDFCKVSLAPDIHSGPEASLSRSEVVTLAVFGQWSMFPSERGFYRWAKRNLLKAFPTLPDRSQFNRLVRHYHDAIVAFFLDLAHRLGSRSSAYEAVDTSAVTTRNLNRRGDGWLAGEADIGWDNRLNTYYEGFRLIAASNPQGVVTGFGFGPATAKDQPLAESLIALRAQPHPRLPSVGLPATGPYVADKGFEGAEWSQRWSDFYGAQVISPPKKNSKHPWPKERRKWLASIRQIIETTFEKIHHTFRLDRERPHQISGFRARLAAKFALHNFSILINRLLGRPDLAFAGLLQW